jgi:hypothetical protein
MLSKQEKEREMKLAEVKGIEQNLLGLQLEQRKVSYGPLTFIALSRIR